MPPSVLSQLCWSFVHGCGVGAGVGAVVGAAVGAAVGVAVGAAVAAGLPPPQPQHAWADVTRSPSNVLK